MPFQIVHNDITNMTTDAIVNAANAGLQAGGGVCGAIFRKAGYEQLQAACDRKRPCPTGSAVITKGFGLPAKYIVHAVGPIWRGGGQGEEEALFRAYTSSLALAKEYGCKSISFPLISSGIYGYPKAEALAVAVRAFRRFLEDNEMDINLVVFDRKAVSLSEGLFDQIQHYIDTYFEEDLDERGRRGNEWIYAEEPDIGAWPADQEIPAAAAAPDREKGAPPAGLSDGEKRMLPAGLPGAAPMAQEIYGSRLTECSRGTVVAPSILKERSLEDLLGNLDETFSEMVLRLITEKGYTDAQVYKRANLDRKLFSKIRSNADYNPKKNTVLALAVGLRLSLDEAIDLLQRAGYSFSPSSKSDIIIRYFLERGDYDVDLINETLFCFEQPLLGSVL